LPWVLLDFTYKIWLNMDEGCAWLRVLFWSSSSSNFLTTSRLLLDPIFLDWKSNQNPSQICDWQSESKYDFQNGLTIQSKSNHNPTIFGKRHQIFNGQVLWCNHVIPKTHLLSTYTSLINQFFENFEKK